MEPVESIHLLIQSLVFPVNKIPIHNSMSKFVYDQCFPTLILKSLDKTKNPVMDRYLADTGLILCFFDVQIHIIQVAAVSWHL